MTYQEWAKEYLESAEILKEQIRARKQERSTAPPGEIKELDFRIRTMYMMYLDCMKTADLLAKRKGGDF